MLDFLSSLFLSNRGLFSLVVCQLLFLALTVEVSHIAPFSLVHIVALRDRFGGGVSREGTLLVFLHIWVKSCEITKNLIKLDLSKIIWFCLKIYHLWTHSPPLGGCMGGCMGGSVGQFMSNY